MLRLRVIILLALLHLISALYFNWKFLSIEERDPEAIRRSIDEAAHSVPDLFAEHSKPGHQLDGLRRECSKAIGRAQPHFNKTVLMIIDALRVDFVPTILDRQRSPRLKHLEHVLSTNGIGLTSVSPVPSVTLPSIKALVSGTLPSFANYILNIKPTQIRGDNIIEQLWSAGARIVCFGDDVWHQMFPAHVFHVINKTESLYVSDYTIVDRNVTWNVRQQLAQLSSWDAMILHYLGVDHIGHGFGYHSNKFERKLRELDEVFAELWQTLARSNESYLVVVLGDHGMNDQGHHGGSAHSETHAAMMFLSNKASDYRAKTNHDHPQVMSHIDFALTFQALLHLAPLPQNQGRLVSSVLERFAYPQRQHLCLLLDNCLSLYQLSVARKVEVEWSTKAKLIEVIDAHHRWSTRAKESNAADIIDAYGQLTQTLQSKLVAQLDTANSHTAEQVLAIVVCYLVLVVIVLHHQVVGSLRSMSPVRWVLWLNEPVVLLKLPSSSLAKHLYTNTSVVVLASVLVAHFLGMGSINYVRNEHLWWQYVAFAIYLVLLIISVWNLCAPSRGLNLQTYQRLYRHNLQLIASLVGCLLLAKLSLRWRRWVQDEQDVVDVTHLVDVHTWLVDNPAAMSLVYVICLLLNVAMAMVMVKQHGHRSRLLQCLVVVVITAGCSYLFRSQHGVIVSSGWIRTIFHRWSINFYAQLVYGLVGLVLLASIADRLWRRWLSHHHHQNPHHPHNMLLVFYLVWCILCTLVIEPSMLPMFTTNLVLERLVHFILSSPFESSSSWLRSTSTKHRVLLVRFLLYTIFAHCGFYQQANTNSLSTVSVTACFVGLDTYNLPACTVLMLVSMYSNYVLWYLAYFLWAQQQTPARDHHHQLPGVSAPSPRPDTVSTAPLVWLVSYRLAIFTQCMSCSFALRQHIFLWAVVCPKLLYDTLLTLITLTLATLVQLGRAFGR